MNFQRCSSKSTEHILQWPKNFPLDHSVASDFLGEKKAICGADEIGMENLLAFHIMKENPWGFGTKNNNGCT